MNAREMALWIGCLAVWLGAAALPAEAVTPTPTPQHRVLFINVNGSYNTDGQNFYNTVVQAGATGTWLNLSSNGQAAALIGSNTYEQIWIYDLSTAADSYTTDWQAVANWFNQNPNRPIICDARIISSYWNGRHVDEGRRLSHNYYENMKIGGGGLFLGTDHNAFQVGINSVNTLIGIAPFSGAFSLTYIPVDTQNPLMFYPNSMGAQLFDDSSPGQTPYGLQANGRILYTVAWHSNNPDTPGISTTIEGAIGFHVTIASPGEGRSFYNEMIPLSAAGDGGTPPYTFEWSSDRDGVIASGAAAQVHTSSLSYGAHTITVLGSDSVSRDDQDAVHITVLSASPTPAPIPAASAPGLILLALSVGVLLVRGRRSR